ncbi:MAG: dienelactone hydrolase family protein [Micrococcales bacterium]|nr:dienelactone hydrolase family protein [Micrococcales bacterium]
MSGRPDDLGGWTPGRFEADGIGHPTYQAGKGPGVVLIPEIPGATPEVLGLGRLLVEGGFTVLIPSPFGEPGRPISGGYVGRVVTRLCVSAEFRAFALGAERPFSRWLRALAADLAARTPGPGVGVIGMCFTGGFALAAAVDDAVLASVLSQPALPFPLGRARQADPGLSPAELDRVAERAAAGAVCAIGLRFSEDRAVARSRFATIADRLGDAFEVIEIDSSPGNPGGFAPSAHSVLTAELREEPGPTRDARDRVVRFLRERLTTPAPSAG